MNLERVLTQFSEDIMIGSNSKKGLEQWDQVQLDLMQSLNNMGKLDLTDTSMWMKFGKEFADYVLSHNMQSPSPMEMVKLLGV